jgi:hypothetical protein
MAVLKQIKILSFPQALAFSVPWHGIIICLRRAACRLQLFVELPLVSGLLATTEVNDDQFFING